MFFVFFFNWHFVFSYNTIKMYKLTILMYDSKMGHSKFECSHFQLYTIVFGGSIKVGKFLAQKYFLCTSLVYTDVYIQIQIKLFFLPIIYQLFGYFRSFIVKIFYLMNCRLIVNFK